MRKWINDLKNRLSNIYSIKPREKMFICTAEWRQWEIHANENSGGEKLNFPIIKAFPLIHVWGLNELYVLNPRTIFKYLSSPTLGILKLNFPRKKILCQYFLAVTSDPISIKAGGKSYYHCRIYFSHENEELAKQFFISRQIKLAKSYRRRSDWREEENFNIIVQILGVPF